MANVAILVGDDFEDSEFSVPYERLKEAGHHVVVLGQPGKDAVHGKRGDVNAELDAAVNEVRPDEFDALVIPGGYGPDHLRTDQNAVEFTRRFMESGKPVAAVCHGPQLLIEAGVVDGKRMTSWPSVRTDLINAGAEWVDQTVVEDGNLISSRKPDDLEDFCDALLKRLH